MSYTIYTPLNVWLDPASITDVVAYIQTYLSENTIYSETEIETIIHDYLIANPELIGGVQSVNGKTGTVVLTASDINTSNNTTIQAVLTSLSGQISEIVQTITGLDTRVTTNATGITNEATARANADTALGNRITALQGAVGSPLVAVTATAMTDTSKIYVYTGSESGYTNGNWYYYNGSAWTSGGVYNATAINTDTTLTVAGMAADAKATGDGLNDLKSNLTEIKGIVYTKGDNLIDFGIIGNTWIQGAWNNASAPYMCHTDHIAIQDGQSKIYLAFNKSDFENETGYTSNGAVYAFFFDANDVQLGQESASSQYQGPYEVDIPSGTSYIVLQISTSLWSNSLTPSMLDSVTTPFAYVGYKTVNISNIPQGYIPYPKNNDDRITVLENNVATLVSDSETTNNKLNELAILEKSDTPEVLTQGGGYYQPDGTLFSPSSTQFLHYDLTVSGGDKYSVTGLFSNDARFVEYIFFDANNNVISYGQATEDSIITIDVNVPNGAVKMGINSYYSYTALCYKYHQVNTQNYISEKTSYWYGKKIVWFGTSIPAGVVNAGASGGNGAYPTRIGQQLGATVYNEAIGSSRVRGGNYHAISADDPMGWGGCEAIGVMLSMSLSRAEKQAIIDAWDSKWKDIMLEPNTYDPDNVAGYLNSSWDTILTKYLTGGSVGQCDLYVFDHGYNDGVITYGFSDLAEIPVQENDRTYWWGAMNFLIGKILADNPKAKILIIGHYNYSSDPFNRGANWEGKYVCDAQKAYAESWGLSCIETWKLLGLTMNTIDVNGTATPVIYARYPDHLHPASDTTCNELKRYADALEPYINMARGT